MKPGRLRFGDAIGIVAPASRDGSEPKRRGRISFTGVWASDDAALNEAKISISGRALFG
jgi:hypothetical protein